MSEADAAATTATDLVSEPDEAPSPADSMSPNDLVALLGAMRQEIRDLSAQVSGLKADLVQLRPVVEAVNARLDGVTSGPNAAVNDVAPGMIEKLVGSMEHLHQRASQPLTLATPVRRSPFSEAGVWEKIGGTPDDWGHGYKIRGLVEFEGELFVTVSGGAKDGTVWSYDGQRWKCRLEGPGCDVNALVVANDRLYLALAGNTGGLYRLDPDGFRRILFEQEPGPGSIGGYSLGVYQGAVYLGCDCPPNLYRLVEGKLRCVAGQGQDDSWSAAHGYGSVYVITTYRGDMYVGLARTTYGPLSASVWSFNGVSWSEIGGNGIRKSWIHPHICYVLDLVEYQGLLVAALTRPKSLPGCASSLYAFDGATWRPLVADELPGLYSQSHIPNHMVVWNQRLYVATGDIYRRVTAIWELQEQGRWRQVAGNTEFPAWQTSAERVASTASRSTGHWIYRMALYGDALYAGLSGSLGGAELWRYRRAPRA